MLFTKKIGRLFALALISLSLFISGCGSKGAQQQQAPVKVKAMKVLQEDVSLADEYAGQIQGTNEVPIQARVSGHVVEKMISGGQLVTSGQPLFRIDNRQYSSAALNAQAQLAQSEATLANTRIDTQRYRDLYKANAVSEQLLTTQEALEKQQEAMVSANRALAQKAYDDLNDTLVISPINGRLYVDDVSIGTFVQAGSTVLVTVGVTDPVYAQFSMSENEYLELRRSNLDSIRGGEWGRNVTLTLSDGSVYPYSGEVTEVDRGLASNSGTLAIKASFANPDGVLLPGMFARVKIEGMTMKGSLLIPQRAVQQVLEKSYVMVVGADNKAQAKQVELGRKIGSFMLVEKGLELDDVVVVEGLTKVQEGIALEPQMVTAEEMSFTFE